MEMVAEALLITTPHHFTGVKHNKQRGNQDCVP